jgi:hypothetical protein
VVRNALLNGVRDQSRPFSEALVFVLTLVLGATWTGGVLVRSGPEPKPGWRASVEAARLNAVGDLVP